MAFFKIDLDSRFGRNLVAISRLTHQDKVAVDLEVARISEMTDAQVTSEYGTTLSKAQLLGTLTDLQTQLSHASASNFINRIG